MSAVASSLGSYRQPHVLPADVRDVEMKDEAFAAIKERTGVSTYWSPTPVVEIQRELIAQFGLGMPRSR